MIAYIYGTLLEKLENSIVIDTGGVGYEVFIPSNSHIWHKSKGEEAVLHTAQIFKEDDTSLYGFEDRASLRLFRLLISVSGVGAKSAMAILSVMTVDEAVRAIAFEDAALLTRAQGIGRKSAERIVLELKDKITEIFAGMTGSAGDALGTAGVDAGKPAEKSGSADIKSEAINVLTTLGISRSEAAQAVMNIKDDYTSVEDCVRFALKGF